MAKNNLKIMGIINLTPDSFSDGGNIQTKTDFITQFKNLMQQGCQIIDIGAESSGPGSTAVSNQDELERLSLAFSAIKDLQIASPLELSIDTYKASVANQALQNGFKIVNDVTGLRGDKQMAATIAAHNAKVVIMYSKDDSARTTNQATEYQDIIQTILEFLKKQTQYAIKHGIKPENIIIDPGMGAFLSANANYSYEVINRLTELKTLGFPILIGTSRKSFLGGKINNRDQASLICDSIAMYNGTNIIRTHNPTSHQQLIKIITQIRCNHT